MALVRVPEVKNDSGQLLTAISFHAVNSTPPGTAKPESFLQAASMICASPHATLADIKTAAEILWEDR
jgi:hypothetical protein